jgi:hypothetical protein
VASTLSRVTDFIPSTPILSAEVDSEFNQIVNLLNSTSSNIKATLKVSDSGDPPLELNQLSTGPILKGFQAGVENFRIRNDGSIRTPGIYDTNDNEQLLFSLTASAVNEFTAKNAATGNPPQLQATGGDTNIGITLAPKGTGVVKIQAGDPVAGEDAANKTYVDAQAGTRRTRWSASFFVQDPSTVTGSFAFIQKALIPGSNFVATHIGAIAGTGADSGAFIINIFKHPFGNQATQTDLGSVNYNPALGVVIGAGKEASITPHTFTASDFIYAVITAVAAPAQRDVNVYIRGYQTPQNP